MLEAEEEDCLKKRGGGSRGVDLTPMMPAEEGMSFRTGFIRITALPRCSASSTCGNRGPS